MKSAVILLFGPPAAGKSSLVRELLAVYRALEDVPALLYLGTDALRETISGQTYGPKARGVVYAGVLGMLEAALTTGHNVIVDGNYLDPEARRQVTEVVTRSKGRLLKILVFCSLEVGLQRNAARQESERVPEDYLRAMYGRLPQAQEDADLSLDSESCLEGREIELLDWLLDR